VTARKAQSSMASHMKRERTAHGVSLREMARQLGLASHAFVARIESGSAKAPAWILEGYERILDLPEGSLATDAPPLADRTVPPAPPRRTRRQRRPRLMRVDEHTLTSVLSADGTREYLMLTVRLTSLVDGLDWIPAYFQQERNIGIEGISLISGGTLDGVWLGAEVGLIEVGAKLCSPLRKGESHEVCLLAAGDDGFHGVIHMHWHTGDVGKSRYKVFVPPGAHIELYALEGVTSHEGIMEERARTRVPFTSRGFAMVVFEHMEGGHFYGVVWDADEDSASASQV
jgi:hypothetical protein